MEFLNQKEWYSTFQSEHPGLLEIGDYTYGPLMFLIWDASTKLKIGKFCQIADDCSAYVGGEHDRKRVSTFPFDVLAGGNGDKDRFTRGDIVIGDDVWIGAKSVILSGSTIGSGSIIGAGSVVRKNTTIPPYSIAIGNPIEVVKYRFSSLQIQALLKIQWWNWPIEKIKEAMPLLTGRDIDAFIEKYHNQETTTP